MNYDPNMDGVSHINIYSRARTKLGRQMSNWTQQHIETEDGPFESVEGHWFWLGTHNERLRKLCGWAAKKYGQSHSLTVKLNNDEFQRKIRQAIKSKLAGNPDMAEGFTASQLPFVHYYVYNEKSVQGSALQVVKIWEELRVQEKAKTLQ